MSDFADGVESPDRGRSDIWEKRHFGRVRAPDGCGAQERPRSMFLQPAAEAAKTVQTVCMPSLPDKYTERDELLIVSDRTATAAGRAFLGQHEDDLLFLTGSALALGELRRLADGLDVALHPELPQPGRFRRGLDNHPMLKSVKLVSNRARSELAVVRYVDNYLTYLADVLREVLRVKPDVLKSSQNTITVEEALGHDTVDGLRAFIADRAVTALSYAGLSEVDDYFKRRLGIPLFDDEAVAEYVSEAVILRNLLTHRRGVVDERSLRSGLPRDRYQLGGRIDLPGDESKRVIAATVAAVLDMDARIAQKFQLDVKAYRSTLGAPNTDASQAEPLLEDDLQGAPAETEH